MSDTPSNPDQLAPGSPAPTLAPAPGDPQADAEAQQLARLALEQSVTTLNRRWMLKQWVFVLVLLAFGGWGLFDAAYLYPKNGKTAADFLQLKYLEEWETTRGVEPSPSVTDPVTLRAELSQRDSLSKLQTSKLAWLDALNNAWQLTPENTIVTNPSARIKELRTLFSSQNQPTAMNWWDIPVQYLITAVGFVGGLWCLVVLIRVASTKYRWNNEGKRLTLPSGQELTPADIEEFDKRKWHKFLIFLKIKPSHPGLGGRELKLDLLPHTPLEAWVLEMERIAFPEAVGGIEAIEARAASSTGTNASAADGSSGPGTPVGA